MVVGGLAGRQTEEVPMCKMWPGKGPSHGSEGPLAGIKAQLWNLSLPSCIPNSPCGFLLLKVFFILGLLPCLTALNTLALETHLFHQLLLLKDFIGSIC